MPDSGIKRETLSSAVTLTTTLLTTQLLYQNTIKNKLQYQTPITTKPKIFFKVKLKTFLTSHTKLARNRIRYSRQDPRIPKYKTRCAEWARLLRRLG